MIWIDKNQFSDFIRNEVRAGMTEFIKENGFDFTKSGALKGNARYLTRKQVSEYLGIAISTVDYWVKIGKLNKIDLDGSPRFDKEEIDVHIDGLRKYNRESLIYSFQNSLS